MAVHFVNPGVKVRWINTAGFEFRLSNGKTLLVDPWLDADYFPMALDEIEGCDYLLLSHIHFDHAASVGKLHQKFPDCKIFVGDLSADILCSWLNLDAGRIYRMRGGETYGFGDIRVKAYSARHTESPSGTYRQKSLEMNIPGETVASESAKLSNWWGSMEMLSYLITLEDGMKILIWGGMPTQEQVYRLKGLDPDLAFLHMSPKIDFEDFADMVKSINARFVVPHHIDGGERTMKMRAEIMKNRGEEYFERFVGRDGLFMPEAFCTAVGETIQKKNPACRLNILEHHKWYRFGLAMEAM